MYTTPLAYFITFTCYGTWLHGDARGTVDHEHKTFGQEFAPANSAREQKRASTLKHPETRLSTEHRDVVRQTICEVCTYRNWQCWEVGVQSNHVHVVVSGDVKPEKILADLKAYATRRLREQFAELSDKTIWAESGSTRCLFDEDSVKRAVQYVQNQ